MTDFRITKLSNNLVKTGLIVGLVLVAAAVLGSRASWSWLGLLVAALVVVILLQHPVLGLFVLVAAALLLNLEIPTGSEVVLNPATLIVPGLVGIVLLAMFRRQDVRIGGSRTFLPLALFLLANLISLLIGNALWDPMVPRNDRFIVVQIAQWLMYVFSAIVFWLGSYLILSKRWLWGLTASFLVIAGLLAIAYMVPLGNRIILARATIAIVRAPFWMLLAALAGGQLLYNRELSNRWRFFLIVTLAAVSYYSFIVGRASTSNWLAVGCVIVVLISLKWPRLRWLALLILLVMAAVGVLVPTIWNFAGGELEWQLSGGSRLILAERVLDVTWRNPITGLGPAAYRNYAAMTPLPYLGAFWNQPRISSHNNYIDIFSHSGVIGLALFFWFVAEMIALILRLRSKYKTGFEAGYITGMLAAGTGALVIMLLADWILPFVYNIGFPGFQASVLVWLFLGGLVALEKMAGDSDSA